MPSRTNLYSLICRELEQDRVQDDVTALLLGEKADTQAEVRIFSKAEGVFSGLAVLEALEDFGCNPQIKIQEGQKLEIGKTLVEWKGPVGISLGLERTFLNILSHLSGVATLTHQYVKAVGLHSTKILATRKTLPGIRDLQLQAVKSGGGFIHRRSLSDGILIKENHQEFLSVIELIARARKFHSPLHRIEVEIQSLVELDKILDCLPDIVMLDNFSEVDMKTAVEKLKGKCQIEVSGGINLERVAEIARLGVDYISVGRLTHSVTALDLSMDIKPL
jgi:nicotinate-nucleotide pyrophosphorylase (carboxylating)